MEEDIDVHISNYETLKRNKHVIKSIDKDYFFEFVDCLIKGYRELEEFKKQVTEIETTNFIKYKNYIPKSKIKEKIEELEKEKEETYTKFLEGNRTDENLSTRGKMIEGEIEVLQELIKEAQWKSLE